MRQWRNLTSLKRSGRGHDPAGVDATQQGQLAVLCPACPQLGKNVPEDLAQVSSNERYVFLRLLIQSLTYCFIQMALLAILGH